MRACGAVLLVLLAGMFDSAAVATADEAVERGRYLFRVAGCGGCHTTDVQSCDALLLAGGRAIETPFGTFYATNITPDPEHGIGKWSREDFHRALREGLSPDNRPYYPAFPYTSYTALSDPDIDDLWRYLQSVTPAAIAERPHELAFPFRLRALLRPWRRLYFKAGPYETNESKDQVWNRGAYLVEVVGHCGECHSPRGFLGQVDKSLALSGKPTGPEGEAVPSIRPDSKHGIGSWSIEDIETYLSFGMTPAGDFAGGAMADVIKRSTQYLSESDQTAIARYLSETEP
jgi:mono/diheme cytochrome c family protein